MMNLEQSTLSPELLLAAQTKKSPLERARFFNDIYNNVLDTHAPDTAPSATERLEEAQNTFLDPSKIITAYKSIFGVDMSIDLPNVVVQLNRAREKYNDGLVPQRVITQILDIAAKMN